MRGMWERPMGMGNRGYGRNYGNPPTTLRRTSVSINYDKCSKCMLCIKGCPLHAITRGEDKLPHIDYSICRGCGICIPSCPTKALFWSRN